MQTITNPILPGFNPDPSILRVGDDFYIATSTFEWFPGVQIHHSRDLVNWQLVAHPLDRFLQLNLVGDVDSGGVWAPCLSYHDGLFYLIYTDTKQWRGAYKICSNYLVTAPNITGPWSDPIYMNSSGFDPSLFHDSDGRKWYVNQLWDFRTDKVVGKFAGIVLQEYDPEEERLVGPVKNIFKGSPLGACEGPHLYKHNGWYYLMTAEGGTGWKHSVTMARSKSIDGPYEIDPQNPMLTSSDSPELPLQKAGHASLVDTPNGDWYLVHLCGRPIGPDKRCMLGRETAIQKCEWTDDGWLRMADGGHSPSVTVPAPDLPEYPFEASPVRDDFDSPDLDINFQTLRVPADESWLSLNARPGFLRLYGREPLNSRHTQSLIARRVQAFQCQAATCLEFSPGSFLQMAGLTAMYDAGTHYYLHVTHHEEHGKCLNLFLSDHNKLEWLLEQPVSIHGWDKIYLRASIDHQKLQFSYSADGNSWTDIGPVLDATKLSDEYCGGFTGAFFGLCAQDLDGQRAHADFDWFEYREEIYGE